MADPTQRIVVDGIDLSSILRFPRILRCVTAALQPPRMVVALLVVVALVAFGHAWDRMTTPGVHPDGYLAGPLTDADRARAHDVMASVVERFVPAAGMPTLDALDARPVVRALEAELLEPAAIVPGRLPGEEAPDLAGVPAGEDGGGFAGAGAGTGAGTGQAGRAGGTDADPAPSPDERIEALQAARADVLAVAPKGAYAALADGLRSGLERAVRSVLYLRPRLALEAGHDVFVRLPVAMWETQRGFTIAYGTWALLVIAVGGAALARMAACELAGEERLRVRDAFDFALGNLGKVLLTPILPLAMAALLAVVLAVVGLLLRVPGLDVLVGVLYGVGLVVGFVLALLLLSYAVASFMLLPALAAENCDAVDAHQRSFAYALNRPFHLLGYGATALAGLALGYVVVAFIAATTLNLSAGALGVLSDTPALSSAGAFGTFDLVPETAAPLATTWHDRWTVAAVDFWQSIVVDLVAAWIVSYYFFSATAVYLLLRRACDGQDVEEIWRPGLVPGTLVPMPADGRRGSGGVGDRVVEGTLRRVGRWRR